VSLPVLVCFVFARYWVNDYFPLSAWFDDFGLATGIFDPRPPTLFVLSAFELGEPTGFAFLVPCVGRCGLGFSSGLSVVTFLAPFQSFLQVPVEWSVFIFFWQ